MTLLAALAFSLTLNAQAGSFNIERWQTSNGAQVVFHQAMEVPMLDVNVAFAAGSAYDGKNFGLSALTTELLDQGNARFDANQIAEKLADTGAQYESETSRDMVMLHLKTLTSEDALAQAMETFSLIITKPALRFDAFNREKSLLLSRITQQQESPDEVANIAFFSKLYKNHPYAHPINGTSQTVKMLSLNQVRNFYKQYFVGNNAYIVIVGAIDSAKAHELAEQLVKDLPSGQHAPAIIKATPLAAAEKANIPYPSSQTVLRLGQIGIDHTVPDYFALMVGNYVLGGGTMVSRLADEVREKRGLTYGVVSQFMPMPGDGPFIISLSTKNSQAVQALQITEETIKGFLQTGANEEELTAAKQYLTGSFPLSLASNSNIAGLLMRMMFYHLPDDYLDTYTARIEAVTSQEIKQAFDKHIRPDAMLLITVGKA
ncbi:M16 family metallopeptidase [Legionella dresdenensis]|uniref:M16 family metallopeptidase n=1 Tax=Legionella dresdenensis TaxID=450200 RepID=A0ABV8CGA2_9GAMM